MDQFPDNFDIDIMHARSLLYNGQLDECIKVLKGTKVLPSEMARESRQLYEWVHLAKAIKLIETGKVDQAKDHIETSREWPKHLGVGRPYDPDERLQNIIRGYLNGRGSKEQIIQRLRQLKSHQLTNGYFPRLIDAAIEVI